MASTAATANRPRKLALMVAALACAKPLSIITRTACGSVSVAVDETASEASQPSISRRCGFRCGSRRVKARRRRGEEGRSSFIDASPDALVPTCGLGRRVQASVLALRVSIGFAWARSDATATAGKVTHELCERGRFRSGHLDDELDAVGCEMLR